MFEPPGFNAHLFHDGSRHRWPHLWDVYREIFALFKRTKNLPSSSVLPQKLDCLRGSRVSSKYFFHEVWEYSWSFTRTFESDFRGGTTPWGRFLGSNKANEYIPHATPGHLLITMYNLLQFHSCLEPSWHIH